MSQAASVEIPYSAEAMMPAVLAGTNKADSATHEAGLKARLDTDA